MEKSWRNRGFVAGPNKSHSVYGARCKRKQTAGLSRNTGIQAMKAAQRLDLAAFDSHLLDEDDGKNG